MSKGKDEVKDQYHAGQNRSIPKPKMINQSSSVHDSLKKDYRLLEKEYNRLLLDTNTLRKHVSKAEQDLKKVQRDFEQFKRETQIVINSLSQKLFEVEDKMVHKKKQ